MVKIPPIKIVMTGAWFMNLFYPHYPGGTQILYMWNMNEHDPFIDDC